MASAEDPKPIIEMRKKLRLMHHPKSTERAYIGWVRRFIVHVGDEDLTKYGADHVAEFLAELVLVKKFAPISQNQALNAVLFYYHWVLAQSLGTRKEIRAMVSKYQKTF